MNYFCGYGYSIFIVCLSYIYGIFIVYLWYVVVRVRIGFFFNLVESCIVRPLRGRWEGRVYFSAGGSLKLDHAAVTICVSSLRTY